MASSLIAVGDELLAGFTLDTNSHWLAERLRLLGFPLKRKTTVRDREPEIAEQLRRDIGDADITDVFCSGGLGPTPDDRTFAAVASALGRELVLWEETRARIERRVRRMHEAGILDSPEVGEGNLRMARIPADPVHVFRNRRGMAPGALYEVEDTRIFVLPGVPSEMKGIFTEELEPVFLAGRSAAVVREIRYTFAVEARFYPVMREVEASHPGVSVGSYPNFETKELVIRCIGADEQQVREVVELIRLRTADFGYPEVV
jgi:molybdenum cofactor synthesis domain-containing protein